ncbi:hypothetical protein F3N43_05745 [Alkalilimnicola sp. S0819]|nr:hypothetical protein F3N43_05745 [Alkalilimnicola sp. S0819]MPQ16135.1 hypothetical protein [Alkalilimnicola sp. S0819]
MTSGVAAIDYAPGTPGGIGVGGDINVRGGSGGGGAVIGGDYVPINTGGDTVLGAGGPVQASSIDGIAGGSYGGGGSGGMSVGGAVLGGVGAPGVVIVYEYE